MSSKGIKQQPVGLQVMVHGTVPTGELPEHPVQQLLFAPCHILEHLLVLCITQAQASRHLLPLSARPRWPCWAHLVLRPRPRCVFLLLLTCSCLHLCCAGAGVSSSSAFVTSAVLAVLAVLGQAANISQSVLNLHCPFAVLS
jgi:hypothetical protein